MHPEKAGLAVGSDRRLEDLANRVVTGDDENLQRFVRLLHTEVGRVVMADRAALAAQNTASNQDASGLWETFVDKCFDEQNDALVVKTEHASAFATYLDMVERGNAAAVEIASVFREVAAVLDTDSEAAAMLKRFLLHNAAAVVVYYRELRATLHPGVEDIVAHFDDILVRVQGGRYLVRPARRAAVAKRLIHAEARSVVLRRLHEELQAWADELLEEDMLHRQVKELLRSRAFAEYLAAQTVDESALVRDEDLDNIFSELEEATDDVAAGLRLNQNADACRSLLQKSERFSSMWQARDAVRELLNRLIQRIDEEDDLHARLKRYLATDTALVSLMVAMDYSPRSPAAGAHEWLSHRVTRNDNGQYRLTAESPEELTNELAGYFSEFRELRRRGRRIDEFATRLADPRLKQAVQSFLGKLMLRDLMQNLAVPQDVDGLQMWIDIHFEESAEGLVLRDGAAAGIADVLKQAAELETQLQQTDF